MGTCSCIPGHTEDGIANIDEQTIMNLKDQPPVLEAGLPDEMLSLEMPPLISFQAAIRGYVSRHGQKTSLILDAIDYSLLSERAQITRQIQSPFPYPAEDEDSSWQDISLIQDVGHYVGQIRSKFHGIGCLYTPEGCLLYTSDAADE